VDLDGRAYSEEVDTPSEESDILVARVSALPGAHFGVKVSFDNFKLYSAQGVSITVACGHGDNPPGGFEHVQHYWISSKDIATGFSRNRFDIWDNDRSLSFRTVPYTIPAPHSKSLSCRSQDFANTEQAMTANMRQPPKDLGSSRQGWAWWQSTFSEATCPAIHTMPSGIVL